MDRLLKTIFMTAVLAVGLPVMAGAETAGRGFPLFGRFAPGAEAFRACPKNEACFRLLWPADAGHPGSELIELQGKIAEPAGEFETPLGRMNSEQILWSLPSGATVAKTRLLEMAGDREDRVVVMETELQTEISGPTGDFNRPAFAAPALTPPSDYRKVWTFKMSPFAPPTREPVPTSGPVALYNDRLEVLILSPLDHFLAAIQAPEAGEWRSGFQGELERVPAGTVHRVLIVQGHGINQTMLRWGGLVQAWYGRERPAADADLGLKYLGYWTDNGAYYYYHTEPGLNYHETLIAVRDDARRRDLPFGYFQLDSWWYPKAIARADLLSAMRGGSLVWEPIPEMFPSGLPAFQQELGLPLIAHNRWYDRNSPYCRRYPCATGVGGLNAALPTDPAFWNEIMDNAVNYGVQVYEQDWLDTQLDMIPWLRSGLGNAESWFDAMVKTAAEHGLTMQLCMASPGFFLEQVKFPNVTTVRASGDYIPGIPKSFFWPAFHQVSLLAYAVGMWPFKDNFQSASGQRLIRNERWPYEEALISTLSAGMVGPSDRIGAADRELLLRSCRRDGVLLKPDRPAFPIDLMFLDSPKPWIVTTLSSHRLGDTYYLAAFRLVGKHPSDRGVTLAELGLSGKYLVYDYRTGEILRDPDRIAFGRMPLNRACYYVLCPALENGMAVIGETDKFVTMSRRRFPSASYAEGVVRLEVEGVPGETVKVALFSPRRPGRVQGGELSEAGAGPKDIYSISVKIPDSGRSALEFAL